MACRTVPIFFSFSISSSHNIYPWAVYCEGPPSFIWRGAEWAKKWGTVIPVYSWHTLSKREQKHYSSLQLTYTPKRAKHKTPKASTLCVYVFLGFRKNYSNKWMNDRMGITNGIFISGLPGWIELSIDVKNLFKVFYFFLKMWFFKVFYFFLRFFIFFI